tara:strand:- start:81 stop:230 length:150 start_codon:yes stop_codon:yes gene_type:complete
MKKKIAIGSVLGLTTLAIGGLIWKIKNVRMWREIDGSLPFPRAKKLGDK